MKKKHPDKILLFTILALVTLGGVALLSASINESKEDFNNIYGYFVHQGLYGILGGGILAYIAYRVPYKQIKKLALPIFAGSLFLMILVFVPSLSLASGAAQRWINLGFITFQPSELIKLTFIIYLAAWLESHHKEMKHASFILPFVFFIGILTILLTLQPDISTLGVIAFTAGAMLFVAGARIRHLALLAGGAMAALYILIQIAPYRLNRITAFLNPAEDPLGISYQINQSLIAVGSGKLWGLGFTRGMQKLSLLPEPMNDSIFAVWSEEMGFIGAVILISLFVLFMWRGIRIANRSNDKFVQFMAIGITTWIFSQTVINIGAIIGLLPLTGIPLPFISYGSSAMITTLIGAGLLLQLSKGQIANRT